MWYQESTDTVYNYKAPITVDGVRYSANVFGNPTVLEGLGIYPAKYADFEDRYYTKGAEVKTFADNEWTFSWEEVPKQFDSLQQELVKYWLQRLDDTLIPTDKYLTRANEMATWFSKWEINPAVQQWRDSVYLTFNSRMNAVTEAVTFEGLVIADEQPFVLPAQPPIYKVEEGEE